MNGRPIVQPTAPPSLLDAPEYADLWAAVVLVGSPDERAAAAARYAAAARDLRRRCAIDLRASGATWAEVGRALGVTLQAAAKLCAEPRATSAYR